MRPSVAAMAEGSASYPSCVVSRATSSASVTLTGRTDAPVASSCSSGATLRRSSVDPSNARIAEAVRGVVVDESHRLHEGVTDRRADELESPPEEIAAESVRFHGTGRNLPERTPATHERRSANEVPDIGVEAAELLLNGKEGLRISNSAFDLEAVANNPRVPQQPLHSRRREPRNLRRIEVQERITITLALLQNGLPAEAGLRSFQGQELEQNPVIVDRHAPLGVVIRDAEWTSCPATAGRCVLRHSSRRMLHPLIPSGRLREYSARASAVQPGFERRRDALSRENIRLYFWPSLEHMTLPISGRFHVGRF